MRRAVAFLTPLGRSTVPSSAALGWFPVVGAAIGLAVGGVWWLAGRVWHPAAAAGVALVADAVLTGGLHLDGLADSGDGLLAPLARQRRLEVMADPAVGAFGVATLVVVVVARFAALASTAAAPLVVGALWCASRTVMAVVTRTVPYARPAGLASAFLGTSAGGAPGRSRPRLAVLLGVGTVLAVGLATAGKGSHGAAAVAADVAAAAGVVALAYRRLGGFTGDVLGAAGVVGETVGLLVLAARW